MLHLDLDARQVAKISAEFAASPAQVRMAYSRALRRSAGTIRRIASRELRSELGLRNAKALRRRIKEYRLKGRAGKSGVMIWFGTNDLPMSAFKGRPRKVSGGVDFNGQVVHGAFLANPHGGPKRVYKRAGKERFPIKEVMVPVADRIMIYIEDNVFVDLEAIFFKHFLADIKARTIYGVGGRNGR